MKTRTVTVGLLLATLAAVGISTAQALASEDPPCLNVFPSGPRVRLDICPEVVLSIPQSVGIASLGGLAFGPQGDIYLARPATKEIVRLAPDGSGFYGPPERFSSGLPEPPIGVAYDAVTATWYVSGDRTIFRLRDRDDNHVADEQVVIVGGLPGGVGGWLGNIRVGPDRRLYVAKASGCDNCAEADSRRAALLSFALDGSDMQIVARGLRDSYDFDWNPANGMLYLVDNERPGMPAELNVLPKGDPGAAIDFGWPWCDPRGQPVAGLSGATASRCAQTRLPAITFDADSHPTGVVFYDGDAFPAYRGMLLVALAGSWNAATTTGYAVMMVTLAPDGTPAAMKPILPETELSVTDASLRRLSFYPYHPIGIAVSPEGWIYVAAAEGRLYRFRPRP